MGPRFITRSAIDDYSGLVGRIVRNERDYHDMGRAVESLCDEARLIGEKGRWQTWQAKAVVKGRLERIELVVSTDPRPEGELPQVVEVRLRGRRNRRK